MRFSRGFLSVFLGLVLFLSCSCAPRSEETEISSAESIEETAAPTEDTTVTQASTSLATVTTEATESTEPENLIDYIVVSDDVVEFLDDNYFRLDDDSLFLFSNEVARIVDGNVLDGILVDEPIEEVTLPTGTILFPVDTQTARIAPDNSTTLFVLLDGRVVVFEYGIDENNMTTWNGRFMYDIFGGMGNFYYPYFPAPVTEPEVDLAPNTQIDPHTRYEVIFMHVDWNGDGIADVFERVWNPTISYVVNSVFYTDGATGIRTDITQNFPSIEGEENSFGMTGRPFLYQGENGEYLIIDSPESLIIEGTEVFVYYYDPVTIVAWQEPVEAGMMIYEDEEYYLATNNEVFGGLSNVWIPSQIVGHQFISQKVGTRIEWVSMANALELNKPLTAYYVCSVQNFEAEMADGAAYTPYTVPAGVALIMQYYQMDDNSNGYLYFLLADGSQCRVNFTKEDMGDGQTFGQAKYMTIPMDELFWFFSGG